MKPYNPKAKCEKCGGKDIHSRYEKNYCSYKCSAPTFDVEHIERYCHNCGFQWSEKPLNKKEKKR